MIAERNKSQTGHRKWRLVAKFGGLILLLLVCAAGAWYAGSPPHDDDAEVLSALNKKYDAFAAEEFPQVTTVEPETLLRLKPGVDVTYVDVREPEERAVSSLPGAITPQQVLCCPEQWRGRRLVAYCTVSYRSGVFAKRAAGQGIHVENIRGGILGWLHAGGKVYDPKGRETGRVHVYGRSWNYAPAEIQAVW